MSVRIQAPYYTRYTKSLRRLLWLGSKIPGEWKMVRSEMKQREDSLFKAVKTMVGNFSLDCVWWMTVIYSQQKRSLSEHFNFCCFRRWMRSEKKHTERDGWYSDPLNSCCCISLKETDGRFKDSIDRDMEGFEVDFMVMPRGLAERMGEQNDHTDHWL